MTDSQIKQKESTRRAIILLVFAVLVSGFAWYWYYQLHTDYTYWEKEKQQEVVIQQQVTNLSNAVQEMATQIDEAGKELVSFTEDRIKYVNLASDLSSKHNLRIERLTVSDLKTEGEMQIMTTSIEVDGMFEDVNNFVKDYCAEHNMNRINIVSCRPTGRYAWVTRGIDEEKVLGWFDLEPEQELHDAYVDKVQGSGANSYGQHVDLDKAEDKPVNVVEYDAITVDKMFAEEPFRIFLEVDFLGRS